MVGAIDFDGDVELFEDAVELRVGTMGTGLTYPFTVTELRALVDGLEPAEPD